MAGDRAAKRGRIREALSELARQERDRAVKANRGVQLALYPSEDDEQPATIAPGRGRPPGAANLAPRDFAEYLVRQGGDVVLRAVRIANADTLELAHALGCDPLEAANLQAKYTAIAAPYQHQELPKPLEVTPETWAGFVMLMGAADRRGQVDPALEAQAVDVVAALSGPSPKGEDLQGLGDDESVVSDTGHSDTGDDEASI